MSHTAKSLLMKCKIWSKTYCRVRTATILYDMCVKPGMVEGNNTEKPSDVRCKNIWWMKEKAS